MRMAFAKNGNTALAALAPWPQKPLPSLLGAVKLMRKYHAGLDDHANFPKSPAASMGSNGWTYDTNGTDWRGYVYPNTGSMPTIQ